MSYSSMRITDIERRLGISRIPKDQNSSPFSRWYSKTRHKTLGALSDGDIARMIRQGLYLQFVLVDALERLSKNPFAGELYDGEIMSAMANVDAAFWVRYAILRKLVMRECDNIRRQLDAGLCCDTAENTQEFVSWLTRLEHPLAICPVCGYGGLTALPFDGDGNPSHETCNCCGYRFGVHEASFEAYRSKWLSEGARWFNPEARPVPWTPAWQLRKIGVKLR